MKKSITSIIGLILLMNYSMGQGSSFGITAGAAFSSYKVKVESISAASKTITGLTVGFQSSIPIGQHCSFMPALNFIQKGGGSNETGSKDKITLNYAELPLNFVYNAKSTTGRFFVGAGPSFSMALSGKSKFDEGGQHVEEDIKFGSGAEDDMKAFEVGANFLAGYQFKGGLLIAANYNIGLNNLANNDPEDPIQGKLNNRYFGIRIGYMFSGKKK